jgi:hypothetical protein
MVETLNPFLIWLICVGIGAILIGFLIKQGYIEKVIELLHSREGFQAADIDLTLSSCPPDSTSYTTAGGDTECCSGEIVNNKCNGTVKCSLSPKPSGGIVTCSSWMSSEWKSRATKFCPSALPYYYGPLNRKSDSVEGCSDQQSNSKGDAPNSGIAKKCKIYSTSEGEYGKEDSCLNIKGLESVKCPTNESEKSIIESDSKLPALFACSYTAPNQSSPVPILCYDPERAKLYMKDKLGGEWQAKLKEKGLSLDTMLALCDTSRKYYIDGSIKATDVRF